LPNCPYSPKIKIEELYMAALLLPGRNVETMNTAPQTNRAPKKVRTAVTLLWVTLGLGLLRSVLEATANAELAGADFMLLVSFGDCFRDLLDQHDQQPQELGAHHISSFVFGRSNSFRCANDSVVFNKSWFGSSWSGSNRASNCIIGSAVSAGVIGMVQTWKGMK
jgi:hypothetical protein